MQVCSYIVNIVYIHIVTDSNRQCIISRWSCWDWVESQVGRGMSWWNRFSHNLIVNNILDHLWLWSWTDSNTDCIVGSASCGSIAISCRHHLSSYPNLRQRWCYCYHQLKSNPRLRYRLNLRHRLVYRLYHLTLRLSSILRYWLPECLLHHHLMRLTLFQGWRILLHCQVMMDNYWVNMVTLIS